MTKKKSNEDPKKSDPQVPKDTPPKGGSGSNSGPAGKPLPVAIIKQLADARAEPDSYDTTDWGNMEVPTPPSHVKRFFPGVCELTVGQACKFWIKGADGKRFTSGFGFFTGLGKKGKVGHFEGDLFYADNPGYAWIGWTESGYSISAFLVKVVPGVEDPPAEDPWSKSTEELLSGRVYMNSNGGQNYIDGVRVTLNRIDGRNIETESLTAKNIFGDTEKGHFGFTGVELGRLPAGVYRIRCYKKTESLATDLWHKKEYEVTLPFKQGEKFLQDIELQQGGQKWQNSGIDNMDNRLNQ